MQQNKSVLIVEDEPLLVKLLVEKLTERGVSVIVAYDGREGLEKAFKLKPDLIVLDILLPFLDGVSLLKELRNDRWGRVVPVIMLTNLSDHRLVHEVKEHDVQGYLIKANLDIRNVIDYIRGFICD